jgi:hypothetical protein
MPYLNASQLQGREYILAVCSDTVDKNAFLHILQQFTECGKISEIKFV